MTEIEDVVRREVKIINRIFEQNSIQAGVGLQDVIVFNPVMIRYYFQYAPNVDESKIQKVMPKIKRELQAFRHNDELPITYNSEKLFIEIEHPNKQSLEFNLIDIKKFKLNAHQVCVGKVYTSTGSVDKFIDLVRSPHLLVAGVTGTGKSIELDNILISLLYSTSPIELEVYLIDFKNKALAAYKDAHHVRGYAYTPTDATQLVKHVDKELQRKIFDRNYKPNTRIVLVIDEYADFTHSKDLIAIESIKRIVSKGREDKVNLILSTQNPTKEVLGDSVIQANLGTRIVGHVNSYIASSVATKRDDLHCEDLPYPGVFYVVDNGRVYKSFSYFITPELKPRLIEAINAQWRLDWLAHSKQLETSSEPVQAYIPEMPVEPVNSVYVDEKTSLNQFRTSSAGSQVVQKTTTGSDIETLKAMFPIKPPRPLTDEEVNAVYVLTERGEIKSKNKACELVFGSKNDKTYPLINDLQSRIDQMTKQEAIPDPKIIRLKRTGT